MSVANNSSLAPLLHEPGPFTDQTLTFGDVRVVVDQASSQLLVGASLDYQDGLQDAGFKINNPSATRTCGCGNSFS
ncbi:MAG: iron-sulfur cluster assembly accessory protein [Actinomycetota bacterium]